MSLEADTALPAGQQFMIDLLVESLMADRGLEDALTMAIAAEMKDGKPVSLYEVQGEGESAVPLLHLVRQLLGNATGKQLSALKKVLCTCMQVKRMYVYMCYGFYCSCQSLYKKKERQTTPTLTREHHRLNF